MSNTTNGGIYTITNTTSGKMYIGQTSSSVKKRLMDHMSKLRQGIHWNTSLQEDFNNNGEVNFVCKELATCVPAKYLNRLESGIIQTIKLTTPDLLYNLLPGGFTKGVRSHKHSKDVLDKINTTKKIKRSDGLYRYPTKAIIAPDGFIWPSIIKYVAINGGNPEALSKAILKGWKFCGGNFSFLMEKDYIRNRTLYPDRLPPNSKAVIGADGFIYPSIAMYCKVSGGCPKLLSAALNRGVGKKKWPNVSLLVEEQI